MTSNNSDVQARCGDAEEVRSRMEEFNKAGKETNEKIQEEIKKALSLLGQ